MSILTDSYFARHYPDGCYADVMGLAPATSSRGEGPVATAPARPGSSAVNAMIEAEIARQLAAAKAAPVAAAATSPARREFAASPQIRALFGTAERFEQFLADAARNAGGGS